MINTDKIHPYSVLGIVWDIAVEILKVDRCVL